MERILNQKHSKEIFVYACSKALERASYFGLRSIMLLYMVGEAINMSREQASTLYKWLITGLIFSQIIGAIFGDLIIGNRRALIIGGVLQALGAFSFCIPNSVGVYTGLILVVIGGGLYSPNILSQVGKLYLHKTKLLDSAFAIFYTAVNIGVFLGPGLTILLVNIDYKYGFIMSGIFMLGAVLIPLFLKKSDPAEFYNSEIFINDEPIETGFKKVPIRKSILNILIALILIGIYWSVYQISGNRVLDLEIKFSHLSTSFIPPSLLASLGGVFILPIGVIAAILWSFWYNNQFVKLSIGFIMAAISYAILFWIPDTPSDQHLSLYLFSFLLMSISELHLSPVIYSMLTQYANPKYLAIIMSLSVAPSKLFMLLFGLFNYNFESEPIFALKLGLIIMTIIGIGLLIYLYTNKKSLTKNPDAVL